MLTHAAGAGAPAVPTFSAGMPRLLLLAVVVAGGAYSRVALSPLQEAMSAAISLSDNQVALLQGPVMAIPLMIASIPLGRIIDGFSRVRLMAVLAALSLVGSLITGIASSFAVLSAARCVVGIAGFGTLPVAISLIADLYDPAQRGRATMAISVGQLFGSSAAFALGGALIAAFAATPDGWRRAMLWLSSPLALVTLLSLGMREPPRTGFLAKTASLRQVMPEFLRYRATIGTLLIGMAMLETAFGAALIWTAPLLSRRHNLPPQKIGLIMATALLASGALGPVLGGTVADVAQRTGGPRRTMYLLTTFAILTVPVAGFALASWVPLVSILVVTLLTLISAAAVMGMTLYTVVLPNEVRGVCVSVSVATNVLFALGLGPVAVSLLSGVIGGPAMIGKALAVACMGASALGVSAFALGARNFPRAALGK